jgi:transposase
MARRKLVTAALWQRLEPLLPQFTPSPKGGRPRVDDERALNGILYVLQSGIPWEELPQELGFGSGMTCWRRLRDWQAMGVWDELHRTLLAELNRAERIDWHRASLDGASVASPRGAC